MKSTSSLRLMLYTGLLLTALSAIASQTSASTLKTCKDSLHQIHGNIKDDSNSHNALNTKGSPKGGKGALGYSIDDYDDISFDDTYSADFLFDSHFTGRDNFIDPLRNKNKHKVFGSLSSKFKDPYKKMEPDEIFEKYDIFMYEEDMLISYTRSSELLYQGSKEDLAYYFSGLEKLPKIKGVFFRGTALNNEELKDIVVGETFTVRSDGVLSTTTEYSVAESFVGEVSGTGEDHRVLFKIHGLSGRAVDFLSANQAEYEVIFLPNTKFKVLKRVEGAMAIYIEMEEQI